MVLKDLLKNIKFVKGISEFLKENKVLDIILFGSVIKGKEEPKDIDLLILFKEKKDFDLSYKLKKKLENFKVQITSKTYKELFESNFKARESILSEGYSFVNKKFLSECFGYASFVLFRYELKGFNKSDRMRFYYSLYGRNIKGMLEKLDAVKFSETVLLCPVINEIKMKKYLDAWKIKYIKFPMLIPKRMENIIK